MRHAATFTLGAIAGALLALLLTQATVSRQPSASRPAQADIRRVEVPARTEVPTLRPSPSHPAVVASPTLRPEAEPAPLGTRPRAGGRPALSTPGATPTRRPRATTRPADGLRGVATWFAAPDGTAAAGPALRAALGKGWRGSRVRVCADGECVTVRLTDWCACGDRHGTPTVIDLGLDAFTRLADPSAGVVQVTIK